MRIKREKSHGDLERGFDHCYSVSHKSEDALIALAKTLKDAGFPSTDCIDENEIGHASTEFFVDILDTNKFKEICNAAR